MTFPLDEKELREIFKEETWPKQCACCNTSYSESDWEALRYVGVQVSGLDGIPDLELRNCGRCSSTMAIVVTSDFVK
jgi:hypothetical protein